MWRGSSTASDAEHHLRKYVIFAALVVVAVGLDQWTKWIATERLAGAGRDYEHIMTVVVPDDSAEMTLQEFLEGELTANTAIEVRQIASNYVRHWDGRNLTAHSTVGPGDRLQIRRRKTVVIPGYWDHEYARNPGAAFGFLAKSDSPYRLPFFIVVGVLALGIVVFVLRGTHAANTLAIVALGSIAGGAIGNFIDRVRLGWVTDFIVWKVGEARWPTFNVADAFISVGVALMLIEIVRDSYRHATRDDAPNEPERHGEDEEATP
jgi:signal peptidase II